MAANEKENKQQKLEYVKNELERLRDNCLDQECNVFRIKKAAGPFLSDFNQHRKRTFSTRSVLTASVVICVLAALASHRPVFKFAAAKVRQATMSVLTIWDWRQIHEIPCVLSNPLKVDDERVVSMEECEMCANLTSVTKLSGSTMEQISEDFLKKELPVIVTTDVDHVSRSGSITVDDICQLYLDDEIMKLYSCCDFESNIEVPKKNHRLFLKRLREGKYTQYYAQWQNCFKDAAKLFRQLYRRPAYLPTTVELSDTNWLLISSNYTHTSSYKMPVEDGVILLIQQSGFIDIILRPREVCQPKCKTLTAQLVKGSALIVTDLLYDIEYRPTKGKPAITVGLGGSFDY